MINPVIIRYLIAFIGEWMNNNGILRTLIFTMENVSETHYLTLE